MMDTDERKELNPPLSILQRLDRLERLMLFLEEKQCYTAEYSSVVVHKCLKQEEQCQSLSYALEQVHHKGTLLERVALLENRVIQLSLDMDLRNTSRSSSSTSAGAEKLGNGPGSLETSGLIENMNMVTTLQEKQEKQDSLTAKDSIVGEACPLNSPSCRARRIRGIKGLFGMGYNRKWVKCLKLGCSY